MLYKLPRTRDWTESAAFINRNHLPSPNTSLSSKKCKNKNVSADSPNEGTDVHCPDNMGKRRACLAAGEQGNREAGCTAGVSLGICSPKSTPGAYCGTVASGGTCCPSARKLESHAGKLTAACLAPESSGAFVECLQVLCCSWV